MANTMGHIGKPIQKLSAWSRIPVQVGQVLLVSVNIAELQLSGVQHSDRLSTS